MYNIGELIQERYEVKNIMMGGMGIVYVCYDKTAHQFIAIKTIQDGLAQSMSGMERFVREASTWISIGHHPNIVFAEKIQLIEGHPYIFMEYVSGDKNYGSSLRGRILQRNIDILFALQIMIQLCDGLAYAQTKIPGLVHRDLKPENILMTLDGIAKVSDFGLVNGLINELEQSLPIEESLDYFQTAISRSGKIVGTPPYMSPEQCLGEELNLRSDVYALGCIFYELVTGQWLLASNNPREWLNWHINKMPVRPSSISPRIPRRIDEIILCCLQKKSADRYSSFETLKQEIVSAYYEISGERYVTAPASEFYFQQTEMDIVRSYHAIEDHKNALKVLDTILQKDPKNVDAWINKGASLMALGKDDDALRVLNTALNLEPDSSRAIINIGVIKINKGAIESAISDLSSVVKLNPSSWEAWNNLGIALELSANMERALDCYNESIKITPWNAAAWENKGRVLGKIGDQKQSKDCYRNAFIYSISHDQRCRIVYQLLGETDFLDNEFFSAALKSIEKSINVRIYRDKMLEQLGGNVLVDKYLSSGLLRTRNDLSYIRLLGKFVVATKRVRKNVSHSERDKLMIQLVEDVDFWIKSGKDSLSNDELKRDVIGLYFFLAASFLGIDDFYRAGKIIRKALDIDSQDNVIRVFYGICLFQMKQWKESFSYLKGIPSEAFEFYDIERNEYEDLMSAIMQNIGDHSRREE